MKEIFSKILAALKVIKWRWWFVYVAYTAAIHFRFLKLWGSTLLGAAVLCVALIFLSHFLREPA
jgi:hypothetical protein